MVKTTAGDSEIRGRGAEDQRRHGSTPGALETGRDAVTWDDQLGGASQKMLGFIWDLYGCV
jgi:hypothetical protein